MYLCFLYLVEELGNCNVKMQIICTSAIEMQSEKKSLLSALGYLRSKRGHLEGVDFMLNFSEELVKKTREKQANVEGKGVYVNK